MFRKLLSSAAAIAALTLLGFAQNVSADDCCTSCGKQGCVSVTETKKVPARCYSSDCDEFCLPKCSLTSGWFKGWWPRKDYCSCNAGCASCDSGCDTCSGCDKCEHPRKRKELVVKIRVHDEQVRRCVPGCADTGCGNTGCAAPATVVPVLPKGEVIPAPKAAALPNGDGEVQMLDDGAPGVAHTVPTR